MIPPIPVRYMADTVAVRVPVEGDWGGSYSEEPKTIEHVRFEREATSTNGDSELNRSGVGTLYVDARNSVGAFEIPVGSRVSVNGGEERTAHEVIACSVGSGVHHWEVTLA